jgi:cytochrome c biogenesis protein CcdA
MFSLAFAFLAGTLTILNPCVLPLVPVVLSGARARGVGAPLALAAGLALTFGIVGTVLASTGTELGDTGVVRLIAAGLMTVFGLALMVPAVGHRLEIVLSPLAQWSEGAAARLPSVGLFGAAGMGAVLAIAWAPCVGPSLGAAIALAATGGSQAHVFATMTVFALGAAASLLSAGFVLGRLAGSGRSAAGRTALIGRTLLGCSFVLVGVAILTGYDKIVEAMIVEAMPEWLVMFATQY